MPPTFEKEKSRRLKADGQSRNREQNIEVQSHVDADAVRVSGSK